MGRKYPGLMLRDMARGDPQIAAVIEVIKRINPDIILLNDFDYDYGAVALTMFATQLAEQGIAYPYQFANRPNSGLQSGYDLDGDGWIGGPDDAHGFGYFSGQQGMALLSKLAIQSDAVKDFSNQFWGYDPRQRLSYKGHWDVPIKMPDGSTFHILASHTSPPVFDDEADRNGKRNHDEIMFWVDYIENLDTPFVILGDLNADPKDGEGSHAAINMLLGHPKLQDPKPASKGAVELANPSHKSDPKHDTVDWDESRTPGNMRVDYVLPSANLKTVDSGVFWPSPTQSGFGLLEQSSHHRLVWLDVELTPTTSRQQRSQHAKP